jgi:sterol desaturase/sphingolipid hydroxylase (fatty acid hydroxylase superfamily)
MTFPRWLIYPLVMAGAFTLSWTLQRAGIGLTISTYVAIAAVALTVAVLERVVPYRAEWHPGPQELTTDFAFIAVVQLLLPPFIAVAFANAVVTPVRSLGIPATILWPHAWPLWAQTALMVLLVDLMRYWLHRACHETDALWRLHSVHHSVDRLYWLNTSRFHPVEKTLQMMLDSLPFLVMGVSAEVLSLYYLTYSANGFLQHSNIDLRYGPLNYIVGSAETHRWHHSREPREANANYGSTLVVWDVIFGTWFLPPDRQVDRLGLREIYPRSFAGLLAAPFRKRD